MCRKDITVIAIKITLVKLRHVSFFLVWCGVNVMTGQNDVSTN